MFEAIFTNNVNISTSFREITSHSFCRKKVVPKFLRVGRSSVALIRTKAAQSATISGNWAWFRCVRRRETDGRRRPDISSVLWRKQRPLVTLCSLFS